MDDQQSNARDQINKSHKMYVHSSMCVTVVVVVVVAAATCRYLLLFFMFKMTFFSFSSFFSRFEPKIFIHEYLMLSRIIRIMCKMLFIYSFIVNTMSQRMSLYAYACLHSCDRMQCMHACVGVHIFVRYKLEHKYRMQNVSLLVNLYIFECRKSQHTHKHKCSLAIHGACRTCHFSFSVYSRMRMENANGKCTNWFGWL